MKSKKLKKLVYKLLSGYSPFPFFLALNITNRCNRQCSWCAYQSPNASSDTFNKWWKEHPGDLHFGEFLQWIEKIGWIGRRLIKSVAITGKGEPMMHEDFILFCYTLDHYKIPFTITTNADFLLDEDVETITQMKYFQRFRIGVYELETAERFIGLPKMELNNMTGVHIDGIKDPELYSMYDIAIDGALKDFNHSTFCKSPYAFLTMYTDGSIVPCYSWRITGNIFKDSFWKIWNGKEIREFRKQAMWGRNFTDADCKNCPQNRD